MRGNSDKARPRNSPGDLLRRWVALPAFFLASCAGSDVSPRSPWPESFIRPESVSFLAADPTDQPRFGGGDDAWTEVPRESLQGGWAAGKLAEFGETGWYRLRFPPIASGEGLAFSPGYLGNIAEIYWNGEKLGQRGSFSPYIGLPWTAGLNVFPLDAASVSPDEPNTVAIRVRNFFGPGGLLGPVPVVAPADSLRLSIHEREAPLAAPLSGLLFLLGTLLAISLPVTIRYWREPFGWSFCGLVLCEFSMHALRARILLAGEWPSLAAIEWVTWLWVFAYPACAVLTVRRLFCEDGIGRFTIAFATAVLLIGGILTPFATDIKTEIWTSLGGLFCGLTSFWLVFASVVRAVKLRAPQARIALAALLVIAGSFLPDFLNFFGPFVSEVGRWTPPSAWGFLLFAGTFGSLALFRLARHRDRSRRLSERLLAIRDDERSRIARDLHDGAARNVAAIKLHLELAAGDTLNNDERSRAVSLLGDVLRDLRQAARGLHPSILDRIPLGEAMRTYARILRSKPEDISLTIDPELDHLEKQTAGQLYRIFQEGLSNAVEHSEANRVVVRIKVISSSFVRLVIEDDGKGLPDTSEGLGLGSIRERVDAEGGKVAWTSPPSGGTRLEVELPIRPRFGDAAQHSPGRTLS